MTNPSKITIAVENDVERPLNFADRNEQSPRQLAVHLWRTTQSLLFLLTVAIIGPQAIAADRSATRSVTIGEIGHFYVGGRQVDLQGVAPRVRFRAPDLPPQQVDPNGIFTVGATYVGVVKLAHPKHPYPIVMMPGGGLSGAAYETTPDGRPGWQWFFLRAGYSTYVVDLDQTGRSSWARYPEINPDEPAFRANAFLWEVFRIGPPGSFASAGGPTAYPGSQFPVSAFQIFAKQAQPRFRMSAESEAALYDELLHDACPCILLTHSASGVGGMAAAARWPALVKAVISVEPADAPDTRTAVSATPHLFVWGDFLDPAQTDPEWSDEYKKSQAYQATLRANGVRADWMALPTQGIHGNSHMLMLDRNSDAVATIIERWLRKQGL